MIKLMILGAFMFALILTGILSGCADDDNVVLESIILPTPSPVETTKLDIPRVNLDFDSPEYYRYYMELEIKVYETLIDWEAYFEAHSMLGDNPSPEEVGEVFQVLEEVGRAPFNDNYITRQFITIEIGEKSYNRYRIDQVIYSNHKQDDDFSPDLHRLSARVSVTICDLYATDIHRERVETKEGNE